MHRTWREALRAFAFFLSLVAGVAVFYAYRQFVGGELANTVFYSFSLLAAYEAWRAAAFLTSRVVLLPSSRPVFQGEGLSLRGEVRFFLPPPPTILILDLTLFPLVSGGKRGDIQAAQFAAFRRRASVHVLLADLPRGAYRLRLRLSSAALLYGNRFSLHSPEHVAYVAVLPSPRVRTKGASRVPIAEAIVDPAEFRPYRVGDPLSHVVWKTFARGRGLWVRGGEVRRRPLFLLLDRHVPPSSEKASPRGDANAPVVVPFERMLEEAVHVLFAAVRDGRPARVAACPTLRPEEAQALALLEDAEKAGRLLVGLPRLGFSSGVLSTSASRRRLVPDRDWLLLAVLTPEFSPQTAVQRSVRRLAFFREVSPPPRVREASLWEAEIRVLRPPRPAPQVSSRGSGEREGGA